LADQVEAGAAIHLALEVLSRLVCPQSGRCSKPAIAPNARLRSLPAGVWRSFAAANGAVLCLLPPRVKAAGSMVADQAGKLLGRCDCLVQLGGMLAQVSQHLTLP